jgi:ATP-binding cassette subfamily B protein
MPLVLLPSRVVGRANYWARKRVQEKLAEASSYMQVVLGISGILLVKAFSKECVEERRFNALNEDMRRLEIRQAMIQRWFGMLGKHAPRPTDMTAAPYAARWGGASVPLSASIELAAHVGRMDVVARQQVQARTRASHARCAPLRPLAQVHLRRQLV